ncbi:hypothetical protein [Nonomuraea sp. NPDC049646]
MDGELVPLPRPAWWRRWICIVTFDHFWWPMEGDPETLRCRDCGCARPAE